MNFEWTLNIRGKLVAKSTCQCLLSDPDIPHDSDTLVSAINLLEKLHVCPGHPDAHLFEMADAKKGVFKTQSGEISASVEPKQAVVVNGKEYQRTIRSEKCVIFTYVTKCKECLIWEYLV